VICRALLVALVGISVVLTRLDAAETPAASPDKPVEYMIYQYPGVALLIQLDLVETEFEAKVFGPERTLIKHSRLPARRVGPVFLLIEPNELARQLIVEIIPAYPTDRSRITMELQQLRENERTDAIQAEAFRLMSRASDATSANDSTTWAGKVYTFKRAAQVFESLGWEELRLWSEFYAAHLVHFKLGDALTAIEMARALQRLAERAGQQTILMAAMQLEGTALTGLVPAAAEASDPDRYEEAHRVLSDTAALADRLGFQSERALALFNDGLVWEQQADLEQALAQYRLALDISISAGDVELANRIRNQAAFAYESQGSVAGAIEMLDQVGDDLAETEAELELSESLFEKGRILNESFRYAESVGPLLEAHGLLSEAGYASRLAQTGLALGRAYFSLGRMEDAAGILADSIARAPVAELSAEIAAGLGMLADARRYLGDWTAMQAAREQQAALDVSEVSRFRVLFDQAMDETARSSGQSATALRLLATSRSLAAADGESTLANRALLQLCALSAGSAGAPAECSGPGLEQAVRAVRQSGVPSEIIEARFAGVRTLRRNGNAAQAMDEMSRLIDEVRFYRSTLPGVLGGWYWGNRQSLFEEYLDLALQRSRVEDSGVANGREALLVLERVRQIASADGREADEAEAGGQRSESDEIRSLLAGVEKSTSSAERSRQASRAAESLQAVYRNFSRVYPAPDEESLAAFLNRLPPDSAFLSYFFGRSEVYAFIGADASVRIRKLPRGGDIIARLENLNMSLGSPESMNWPESELPDRLESLGQLLLRPVEASLPSKIFLLPLGLLRGFPFDLLRLDGRYLAERFQVIQLMSLSPDAELTPRLDLAEIDRFFLAGDPELTRDVFSYEQRRSAEISAVTDLFVGPALHIVQGPALKSDEFDDARFADADVVHLSIPTLVELRSARQSEMTLSSSGDALNSTLRPDDLPSAMNASLAVLSLARFQNPGSEEFGSRLGFISNLLDAGTDAVISSLWSLDDASRAGFMAAFYGSLAGNPDLAAALYRVKREFIPRGTPSDPGVWAAFQLFVR
jgi:tetratricopeptide (TPR) repeat protein